MKSQSAALRDGESMISYGFKREIKMPFAEAVERTRTALGSEGFGVLCEIDIKQKLQEKLGIDFGNYVILGTCNPPLAYEALQQEIDLGLLLPCNVVIYEDKATTVVGVINAATMLSVVGNEQLNEIAHEVNKRLQSVIEAL